METSESVNITFHGSKPWPVIRGSQYVPWGARVALTLHLDKVCSNNTSYVCHHRKVLANNRDDSCFLIFPLRNDGTNSLIGLLPCTTPPISYHHTSFLFSYSIHLFIYYLPSPHLFFLSVYRVFVLEEDSDSVSRGAFFSLLHLSFILLLYVFHAGKGSSSCMQQAACSVWSCPIRDLTVWCYSPQPRGILSLSSSLTVILFSFPITDYFILFSDMYFLNLAPKPLPHSPELSLFFCSQPILSKFVCITPAETENSHTLTLERCDAACEGEIFLTCPM